jgi:hypothetical protein
MANRKWSDDELNQLQWLLGDLPWPLVVQRFNIWAKRNGHVQRTELAMRRKVEQFGGSRRAVGAWITTGLVCQLMGVSHETPLRWLRDGWITSLRFGDGPAHNHYIKRQDLRKLARLKPHIFGGQDEATLIQLLDQERLAKTLVAMELPLPRQRKPVVCIETGRRYPSIGKAARAVYVTPSRLQKVVGREDRTAAGCHWRVA